MGAAWPGTGRSSRPCDFFLLTFFQLSVHSLNDCMRFVWLDDLRGAELTVKVTAGSLRSTGSPLKELCASCIHPTICELTKPRGGVGLLDEYG